MSFVLWIIAVVGLILAYLAGRKATALQERIDGMVREHSVKAAEMEELKPQLDQLRKLIGLIAGGHDVDPAMVRDGRLYQNVSTAELDRRLAAEVPDGERDPAVIDVRSQREWAGGHIPGAVHIPVEEIEERMREVPRDGRPLYVVCAGGGRSASASDFLAGRGYLRVHNVEGGMNSWKGAVTQD